MTVKHPKFQLFSFWETKAPSKPTTDARLVPSPRDNDITQAPALESQPHNKLGEGVRTTAGC